MMMDGTRDVIDDNLGCQSKRHHPLPPNLSLDVVHTHHPAKGT